MEKIVRPSQCPGEGAQDAPRGHTGSTRDGQEAEGARRRHGALGRNRGGLGLADFGLASLKNFRRLWGIGAAPRCVALGPGVMRMGEYWSGA